MKGIDKYHETSIKEIDEETIKSYKMYDRYIKSPKKDAKVLEIGPGNGGLCYYLQQKYKLEAKNFFLVDIAQSIIDELNNSPKTKNFNNIQSDLQSFLEKNTIKYDIIIMIHVLEHLPKEEANKILEPLIASLNPGGKILIEVSNVKNMPTGFLLTFGDYSHYGIFNDHSMNQYLNRYSGSQAIKTELHNIFYPIVGIKTLLGHLWEKITYGLSFLLFFANSTNIFIKREYNKVFSPRLLAVISKKHD